MKTKIFLSTLLVFTFVINSVQSQSSYENSIQAARNARNLKFETPGKTPLNAAQIQKFKGLSYFAIDSNARVQAVFTPARPGVEVSLNATNGTKIKLIKYGTVTFSRNNKSYTLDVFQNNNLPEFGSDNSILFIPFTDPTNNGPNTNATNSQGRYLQITLPASGNRVTLDFNMAENPYNAYNKTFVSIIPPPGNAIMSATTTGERKFEDRAN
jgi:uncharacterized protein